MMCVSELRECISMTTFFPTTRNCKCSFSGTVAIFTILIIGNFIASVFCFIVRDWCLMSFKGSLLRPLGVRGVQILRSSIRIRKLAKVLLFQGLFLRFLISLIELIFLSFGCLFAFFGKLSFYRFQTIGCSVWIFRLISLKVLRSLPSKFETVGEFFTHFFFNFSFSQTIITKLR